MSIDITWLSEQFPEVENLSSLGIGGQKYVFSGINADIGKVVLKIYRSIEESDIERINREISAVRSIQSSRVPKIYKSGIRSSPFGELIWVQEELIAGHDLRNYLQMNKVLQPQEVLRLGLHMLEALRAAEEKSIVHRDVKPANIMVDSDKNYWLLDFGLARHLQQVSLTDTNLLFGPCTPGYSPPEQFNNRKSEVDSRADLFALGVTLYESNEGINPFYCQSDMHETLRRVEGWKLPDISRKIDTSNEFSDFVRTITQKRPDHRLPNITEALEWIQEICNKEGIY